MPQSYDPTILVPLDRPTGPALESKASRDALVGLDRWTVHEFSWLNDQGMPQMAKLRIDVPLQTRFIIESKSMKLYLGSLAFERMATTESCITRIRNDLESAMQHEVSVTAYPMEVDTKVFVSPSEGIVDIDKADVVEPEFMPKSGLLRCNGQVQAKALTIRSHLLRTICPVTGQPDYATVYVRYHGECIDTISLLAYLIGFRREPIYHELAVERVFSDISRQCSPESLGVLTAFARRGGIDIASVRATVNSDMPTFVQRGR